MSASVSHLNIAGAAQLPGPERITAREEQVLDGRGALLAHLADGLEAIAAAAAELDALRSPAVYDLDLAEGRDGRDVAAHIDGAIRGIRAAAAVAHMVFAKESL
jgi:hypothetical protein